MIYHIVLFRAHPDLTAAARDAFVKSVEHALGSISSIRRFHLGRRVTVGAGYEQGAENMEYVGIVEFDDLAGLQAYLQHPAHADMGERFYASSASSYIYDYDMRGVEGLRELL